MKSELAVGDSTWIELIFTAGSNKSPINKNAKVTTNDTIVGGVSISFKGEAVESTDSVLQLSVDPFELNFGPIEKKRRPKLETEITNRGKEEMELQIVAIPPNYFKKVELSDTQLKPGDDTKLKVELTKEKEGEQFRKTITLEGKSKDNNNKFRISIPVTKGFGEEGMAKKESTAKKEGTAEKK
jgi:hypothetical protein